MIFVFPSYVVTGEFRQHDIRVVVLRSFGNNFSTVCERDFVLIGISCENHNVVRGHNGRNFSHPIHKVVTVVINCLRSRSFDTDNIGTFPNQMFNGCCRVTFRSNTGRERQLAQRVGFVQLIVVVVASNNPQRVVVTECFGQAGNRHFARFLVSRNVCGIDRCSVVVDNKRAVVHSGNFEQFAERFQGIVLDCRLFGQIVAIFIGNFECQTAAFVTRRNVDVTDVGCKHIGSGFAVQRHDVVDIHRALGCLLEFFHDSNASSFLFFTGRVHIVKSQCRVSKRRPHDLCTIDAIRTGDTPSKSASAALADVYAHLAVVEVPASADSSQVDFVCAVFFRFDVEFRHYRAVCTFVAASVVFVSLEGDAQPTAVKTFGQPNPHSEVRCVGRNDAVETVIIVVPRDCGVILLTSFDIADIVAIRKIVVYRQRIITKQNLSVDIVCDIAICCIPTGVDAVGQFRRLEVVDHFRCFSDVDNIFQIHQRTASLTCSVDFGNGHDAVFHRVFAGFKVDEIVAYFNGTTKRQIPREVAFLNCERTQVADTDGFVGFVVSGICDEIQLRFFVVAQGELSGEIVSGIPLVQRFHPVGPSKGHFCGADNFFALAKVDGDKTCCAVCCLEHTCLRIDCADVCSAVFGIDFPSEVCGQSNGITIGIAAGGREVDCCSTNEQILIGQNLCTSKGVVVFGNGCRILIGIAIRCDKQNCASDGTVCAVGRFDAVGVGCFAFVTRKSRGRSAAVQVERVDAAQIFHDGCHCVEAHSACAALVAAFANVGDNGAVGLDADCRARMFFVPQSGITKRSVVHQRGSVCSETADSMLHFVVGVVHFDAVFGTFERFATLVVEEI